MEETLQAPQTQESNFTTQKKQYFFKLGLKTREALRLHIKSGLWEKNSEGKRDWGNVSEHCLAEVARFSVFSDILGLSEELKTKGLVGAALHDFNKKDEIIRAKKAYAEGKSVWDAFEKAGEEKNQTMRNNGIDNTTIRLANTAPFGSIPETEEVLKKETLTEEDIAFLTLHYLDDISRESEWVKPAQNIEGKQINELDRRLGEGVLKNQVYEKLNEEGREHFEGKTVWEKALKVGKNIEIKLANLVSQKIGYTLNPSDLPEFIDEHVKEDIKK